MTLMSVFLVTIAIIFIMGVIDYHDDPPSGLVG